MKPIIIVGYEAYDFSPSLIVGKIEFLDCEFDLGYLDYLIFTSKNAIRALQCNADKYPKMQKWKEIPSLVIGEGSAKVLAKLGGRIASVSKTSYGNAFSCEIAPLLTNKKALYVRGEQTASDLQTLLISKGIELQSLILYRNTAMPFNQELLLKKPPAQSFLLFTSPSAYHYFCKLFAWDMSYTAIALGQTTYEAFELKIKKMISPFREIKKSVLYLEKSI